MQNFSFAVVTRKKEKKKFHDDFDFAKKEKKNFIQEQIVKNNFPR